MSARPSPFPSGFWICVSITAGSLMCLLACGLLVFEKYLELLAMEGG
jgi:hypothetical protein